VHSFEDALETLQNLKFENKKADYQILKKTTSFEVVFHDSAQMDLF
jgi:hypothetical protein